MNVVDHPVEIMRVNVINSVQYGTLTDYSKNYYHIDIPEPCILLQRENTFNCTHALTYTFKNNLKSSSWIVE